MRLRNDLRLCDPRIMLWRRAGSSDHLCHFVLCDPHIMLWRRVSRLLQTGFYASSTVIRKGKPSSFALANAAETREAAISYGYFPTTAFPFLWT